MVEFTEITFSWPWYAAHQDLKKKETLNLAQDGIAKKGYETIICVVYKH